MQTVYDFALDERLFIETPLKDRLLFQMDSVPSVVVAHRSIAGLCKCDDGNSVVHWSFRFGLPQRAEKDPSSDC